MKNKDEEDISWLFLWGATILYIAVLCMSFAGLVALGEHGKSVVETFTEFVKDYGSLIAGIPVLIAVLVAKQQLEANRLQHVAQIKRSFLPQIEAAEELQNFYNQVKKMEKPSTHIAYALAGIKHPKISPPTDQNINDWALQFSEIVLVMTKNTKEMALNYNLYSARGNQSMARDTLDSAIASAEIAMELIDQKMSRLSQYWS